MRHYSEWPWTKKVLTIDGIRRPNVSKQVFAVSIAKYIQILKGSSCTPEEIAHYINAVGDIHGPRIKIDVPGIRYAKFAIKLLNGKTDSHINNQPPGKWLNIHNNEIVGCFEFIKKLYEKMKNAPTSNLNFYANEYLINDKNTTFAKGE